MANLKPGFQETRIRQCVKLDELFRDRAYLPVGRYVDVVCYKHAGESRDHARLIVDTYHNPLAVKSIVACHADLPP
jgi:hypothetical protein